MNFKLHKQSNSWSQTRSTISSDKRRRTFEFFEELSAEKIKLLNGLVLRKEGRGLIGILLKYLYTIHSSLTRSRVIEVVTFCARCNRLARTRGLKGLVIYLKACQVMLQQSVGHYYVVNLSELKINPKRTRSGLPLMIPPRTRKLIRRRDIYSIRLWMSLFGLYRILSFPGNLSFATITDPPSISVDTEAGWDRFVKEKFIPLLKSMVKFPSMPLVKIFPIPSSSPTSSMMIRRVKAMISTSPGSVVRAARLWVMSGLLPLLSSLSEQLFSPAFTNRVKLASLSSGISDTDDDSVFLIPSEKGGAGYLGKLGFKDEPAGKIRVFAMVDCWTQWLMKPFHDFLFAILRQIPMDGTFDQMAPIKRLQDNRRRLSSSTFFSIDLSAATDRLPISIQASLVKWLLEGVVPSASKFAIDWVTLLVGRRYKVVLNKDQRKVYPYLKYVKYRTGQPMGALSSWAMLALTHHVIVQYAAYRAGVPLPFKDYGVLGDDLVIANGKVGRSYLNLIKLIGVKVGLAKSIVSKRRFVLEFAKKFFVDSTTANMVPFKDCITTSLSTAMVPEFVREYKMTLNQTLAFLGYGYKVRDRVVKSLIWKLPTRLRVLLVLLLRPGNPFGLDSYWDWLMLRSFNSRYFLPKVAKIDMLCALYDLLEKQYIASEAKIKEYSDSLADPVNFDRVTDQNLLKGLDLSYPIEILGNTSKGLYDSNAGFSKEPVSWRYLLNEDLSEASIVDMDWSKSFQYTALSSLPKVSTYNPTDDWFRLKLAYQSCDPSVSLGPPYRVDREYRSYMYDESQFMRKWAWDWPESRLTASLSSLLKLWVEGDGIEEMIPRAFWPAFRLSTKPFTGFIQTYYKWKVLTAIMHKSFGHIPKVRPKVMQRGIMAPLLAIVTFDSSSLDYFNRLMGKSIHSMPKLGDRNSGSRGVGGRWLTPVRVAGRFIWQWLLWCYIFGITLLLFLPDRRLGDSPNPWVLDSSRFYMNPSVQDLPENDYGWIWILIFLLIGLGLIYWITTFRYTLGSNDPVSIDEVIDSDLTRLSNLGLTAEQQAMLQDLVSVRLVENTVTRDRLFNLLESLRGSLHTCQVCLGRAVDQVSSSSVDLTTQYAEKISEVNVLTNTIQVLNVQIVQINEALEKTSSLLILAEARVRELELLVNQPYWYSCLDSATQTMFEQSTFGTDTRLYDLANSLVLTRPVFTFNNRLAYGHTLDSQLFVNFNDWTEFMEKLSALALYFS